MSSATTNIDNTTLGELLRETRIRQGLDLQTVAEHTRIAQKNLQAIEDGNFASLPAEVFTRGYYTLYAKMLGLDPEQVLLQYDRERKHTPKNSTYLTPPPNRLAQNIKNLADPPSSSPVAYLGLVLLLLLLFGAFLCWYFSWNPASYLSNKLRSFDTPTHSEKAKIEKKDDGLPQLANQNIATTSSGPKDQNLLRLPSPAPATAATTEPGTPPAVEALPDTTKYHVNAIFLEDTKISLIVDNLPKRSLLFKKGELVSWRATEKILITLPARTNTRIALNDIPLQLPKTDKETVTIAIPDSLLR